MSYRVTNKKHIMILNITVAIWVTVMFILLPACSKKKELAEAVSKEDSLPDMRTTGVTTFISDSGMIRYKIITAEWLIFSEVDTPFWAFEKGIYLEKFDTLFHIDASIKQTLPITMNQRSYGNFAAMYTSAVSAVINLIPN